jgi:hypothetical protein
MYPQVQTKQSGWSMDKQGGVLSCVNSYVQDTPSGPFGSMLDPLRAPRPPQYPRIALCLPPVCNSSLMGSSVNTLGLECWCGYLNQADDLVPRV